MMTMTTSARQAYQSQVMSRYLGCALTRKHIQALWQQSSASASVGAGDGDVDDASLVPPKECRHLSLFDLVAFGVGSTIGSGVFVLAGLAAHSYAGPSSSISYLLSGLVISLSVLPYAELSAAFPVDGSTYTYAYITLGEVFAVIACLCQTLEYGIAGAAVARSWGEKFVDWVNEGHSQNEQGGNHLSPGIQQFLEPGYGINPMAAIIVGLCTIILLCGVQESKLVTNIVAMAKVSLIIFMIVAGLLLSSDIFPNTVASFSNWKPFVPPEFGGEGILEAASILLFAYLGFDCICNRSGEAKDAVRDVPKAIIYTVAIDGILYTLAALTLTAMLPYTEISDVSGFPRAFGANGWIWAEKLTAIGEIVVLPLVVLTSILSQTRLFFALSQDNLLPSLFSKISFSTPLASSCCGRKQSDEKIGNLTASLSVCGLVMLLLALFVPFDYLDELVSAGALLLFSLTDCCLFAMRYECPTSVSLLDSASIENKETASTLRRQLSIGYILILLNLFSCASGLCFKYIPIDSLKYSMAGLFLLMSIAVTICIAISCKESSDVRFNENGVEGRGHRFRTPFVPYLPALGIYVNWFLMAHIGWVGMVMLVGYVLVGVLLYAAISCMSRENDKCNSVSDLQEALLEGNDTDAFMPDGNTRCI